MKKMIFVLSVSLVIVSCGKSKSKTGNSMGEEICECFKKAQALDGADANKMTDLNKCAQQQKKYYDELMGDAKKLAEYSLKVANCGGK